MNEQALVLSDIDNVKVWLSPDAEQIKLQILNRSRQILTVDTSEELTPAVERVREMKRFMAVAEACRVERKAPAINYGKRLDEIVANFVADIEAEIVRLDGDKKTRVKGLITIFNEREFQRQEQERQRIENERIEAERKTREALEEQERLANKKKTTAAQSVQAEVNVEKAIENLNQIKNQAPAPVVKVAGLTAKRKLVYEILDPRLVYQSHPEYFDLVEKKSVINNSLFKGMNVPGMRVTEEIDTTVRR
jgi:hypothetical protein